MYEYVYLYVKRTSTSARLRTAVVTVEGVEKDGARATCNNAPTYLFMYIYVNK